MTDISSQSYNVAKTESQMRKGFLEFPVLLIVGAKPTYVPDILEQLKAADLLVVEGTLYPLLSRMKKAGLVDYSWEESMSGPPRKIYEITPVGTTALSALESSWNKMSAAVTTLIKHYEKSN